MKFTTLCVVIALCLGVLLFDLSTAVELEPSKSTEKTAPTKEGEEKKTESKEQPSEQPTKEGSTEALTNESSATPTNSTEKNGAKTIIPSNFVATVLSFAVVSLLVSSQ